MNIILKIGATYKFVRGFGIWVFVQLQRPAHGAHKSYYCVAEMQATP